MILYFSGTGNSEYAAKRIGREIKDEVLDLFEKIRSRDYSELHSDHPWVVAVPTYAWRIPRIVQEWLENTKLTGSKDIYFVMTCGGDIGNAGRYLEKLCDHIGITYKGCMEVVMPENYIALFSSPDREEALGIIQQAKSILDTAALRIRNRETFTQTDVTIKARMNSGIVNTLFYPMFVHAKKFYADERCISCGKCALVCPLTNIHMEKGRPVWGHSCTHCMACICRCPATAIEYGKNSKGKVRYTFPEAANE